MRGTGRQGEAGGGEQLRPWRQQPANWRPREARSGTRQVVVAARIWEPMPSRRNRWPAAGMQAEGGRSRWCGAGAERRMDKRVHEDSLAALVRGLTGERPAPTRIGRTRSHEDWIQRQEG